jgi:hypothetical protein
LTKKKAGVCVSQGGERAGLMGKKGESKTFDFATFQDIFTDELEEDEPGASRAFCPSIPTLGLNSGNTFMSQCSSSLSKLWGEIASRQANLLLAFVFLLRVKVCREPYGCDLPPPKRTPHLPFFSIL